MNTWKAVMINDVISISETEVEDEISKIEHETEKSKIGFESEVSKVETDSDISDIECETEISDIEYESEIPQSEFVKTPSIKSSLKKIKTSITSKQSVKRLKGEESNKEIESIIKTKEEEEIDLDKNLKIIYLCLVFEKTKGLITEILETLNGDFEKTKKHLIEEQVEYYKSRNWED